MQTETLLNNALSSSNIKYDIWFGDCGTFGCSNVKNVVQECCENIAAIWISLMNHKLNDVHGENSLRYKALITSHQLSRWKHQFLQVHCNKLHSQTVQSVLPLTSTFNSGFEPCTTRQRKANRRLNPGNRGFIDLWSPWLLKPKLGPKKTADHTETVAPHQTEPDDSCR